MTRYLTGLSVIALIAGGVSLGHAQTLPALPPNIHVLDAGVRSTVLDLIDRSPTFRSQCDAIAGTANVSVSIGRPIEPMSNYKRSRLTLRRYDTGVIAHIELPPLARGDALAYDLAYVIERAQQGQGYAPAGEANRADAVRRAVRSELWKADASRR